MLLLGPEDLLALSSHASTDATACDTMVDLLIGPGIATCASEGQVGGASTGQAPRLLWMKYDSEDTARPAVIVRPAARGAKTNTTTNARRSRTMRPGGRTRLRCFVGSEFRSCLSRGVDLREGVEESLQLCGVGIDNQQAAGAVMGHLVGDASQHEALYSTHAPVADHNEIRR